MSDTIESGRVYLTSLLKTAKCKDADLFIGINENATIFPGEAKLSREYMEDILDDVNVREQSDIIEPILKYSFSEKNITTKGFFRQLYPFICFSSCDSEHTIVKIRIKSECNLILPTTIIKKNVKKDPVRYLFFMVKNEYLCEVLDLLDLFEIYYEYPDMNSSQNYSSSNMRYVLKSHVGVLVDRNHRIEGCHIKSTLRIDTDPDLEFFRDFCTEYHEFEKRTTVTYAEKYSLIQNPVTDEYKMSKDLLYNIVNIIDLTFEQKCVLEAILICIENSTFMFSKVPYDYETEIEIDKKFLMKILYTSLSNGIRKEKVEGIIQEFAGTEYFFRYYIKPTGIYGDNIKFPRKIIAGKFIEELEITKDKISFIPGKIIANNLRAISGEGFFIKRKFSFYKGNGKRHNILDYLSYRITTAPKNTKSIDTTLDTFAKGCKVIGTLKGVKKSRFLDYINYTAEHFIQKENTIADVVFSKNKEGMNIISLIPNSYKEKDKDLVVNERRSPLPPRPPRTKLTNPVTLQNHIHSSRT